MTFLNWYKEHIIEILAIVTLIACLVLIGAGCVDFMSNESNRISEGTVIDKEFAGAYTSVTYTKVGDAQIPQNVYHPESYRLKIQGEKDGELVTYWFECTAEEYQQYSIGDYYKK